MLTVVVIEEDMAMRTLIREWLMAEGHTVRLAPANAQPAGTGEADLVIVNLLHPRSRGAERVRDLKDLRAAYPRAALIGISTQLSRSLPGHSALARSLGVRRLIAKPFEREELIAAVAAASPRRGPTT